MVIKQRLGKLLSFGAHRISSSDHSKSKFLLYFSEHRLISHLRSADWLVRFDRSLLRASSSELVRRVASVPPSDST